MNREHIISLAKECGATVIKFKESNKVASVDFLAREIELFYQQAQREAYERAAQVCEELSSSHKRQVGGECDEDCDIVLGFDTCAEAIRKLKEESCKS